VGFGARKGLPLIDEGLVSIETERSTCTVKGIVVGPDPISTAVYTYTKSDMYSKPPSSSSSATTAATAATLAEGEGEGAVFGSMLMHSLHSHMQKVGDKLKTQMQLSFASSQSGEHVYDNGKAKYPYSNTKQYGGSNGGSEL
jgi:hypothetical protein